MKLNLSTLSFGSYIDKGGGTPSWGTELGQSKPDYKFTVEGCEEISVEYSRRNSVLPPLVVTHILMKRQVRRDCIKWGTNHINDACIGISFEQGADAHGRVVHFSHYALTPCEQHLSAGVADPLATSLMSSRNSPKRVSRTASTRSRTRRAPRAG